MMGREMGEAESPCSGVRCNVCRASDSLIWRDAMPSLRRRPAPTRLVIPFAILAAIIATRAAAQSPAPAPAQSSGAGRPLAIEDFYRLKTVGTPELSPDAKWVAFTVSTRVEETNGIASEVWLVAASGASPARPVSQANAVNPRWLDDGRLAFTANGREVRIDPASPERVDTGAVQAGATVPGGALGGRGMRFTMQSSPDGKWIATLRNV